MTRLVIPQSAVTEIPIRIDETFLSPIVRSRAKFAFAYLLTGSQKGLSEYLHRQLASSSLTPDEVTGILMIFQGFGMHAINHTDWSQVPAGTGMLPEPERIAGAVDAVVRSTKDRGRAARLRTLVMYAVLGDAIKLRKDIPATDRFAVMLACGKHGITIN